MQLQNFECQIAKAQIGRFVAGDLLSDEALRQLEAHLACCPGCKNNLAERRVALQAMLTPDEAIGAPSDTTKPARKLDLANLIKSKVLSGEPARSAQELASPKGPNLAKPAVYSIALGVVLIGMSLLSRNMDSVLGPKAGQGTNPVPAPSSAAGSVPSIQKPSDSRQTPPAPPTSAKPVASATVTIAKPLKLAPSPDLKPSGKSASSDTKISKIQRDEHGARPRKSNSIRVYDPEN